MEAGQVVGQATPGIGADVTSLMRGSGNVDLYAQPKVNNPDGSVSTVDSHSYNIDGKEVLLPSVTPDGRHLTTDKDIIAEYTKTGRHLGKFNTVAEANAYAEQLHNDYAAGKYDRQPAPAVGDDVTHLMTPHFSTANEKDAKGDAVVDPSTIGPIVKHLWDGVNPVQWGQMLPWPKALGGSGMDNPLHPSNIVAGLAAVKKEAQASLAKGDYVGAYAKYVESVIPVLGPMMAHWGNGLQAGKYKETAGDVAAFAANLAMGKIVPEALAAKYPLAARPGPIPTRPDAPQTPVQFGQTRGVPIDAATATDNWAVKGAQQLADRSLGGSLVATPANAERAAAMTRVGDELATEAHPVPTTPEMAGESVRDALTRKRDAHGAQANTTYDSMRFFEGPETNVNLAAVKKAFQPIVEQMRRQMPLTQQQANPGLKALQNILDGPDYAPLSQVDRDLSTIKGIARDHGGLAKIAVRQLNDAVEQAAKAGDPIVWQNLQAGRAATRAKYAASDVLDTLHHEPVRTITKLTAPKDAGVQALRALTQQVPEQAPVIARAYLEDLLAKPNAVSEWRKLGTQTKAILFPKAGLSEALDNFFKLADRISKTNVNPSQSGYVAALGAQGAMVWYDPASAAAIQISGVTMAKLLRSPVVVRALTRGLQLPATAPAAVRVATTANLVRAAHDVGVDLALPKAAAAQPTGTQP